VDTVVFIFCIVLIFIPFFNFGKIFLDISRYATGRLNVLTNTYVAGDGEYIILIERIIMIISMYFGN
jgi:hypothetical protein